ncbi:MAG: hypothetical protein KKD39_06975 [Candidatus Altiarchaeota archaeon]|nr:hypothetical protein [Candidatus Altiarchaeota archaeon]
MFSFRILKRKIVDVIAQNKSHNPVLGPLLLSTTLKLKNVSVIHKKRMGGRSGYSTYKIVKSCMDNIINFSTLPLKIASIFGTVVAFMSFSVGSVFIFRKLFLGIGPDGWTSLVVLHLFSFGTILTLFGIMGEYLIRISRQVNYEPQYHIREIHV